MKPLTLDMIERVKALAGKGWDADMVAALLDISFADAARVMGNVWIGAGAWRHTAVKSAYVPVGRVSNDRRVA